MGLILQSTHESKNLYWSASAAMCIGTLTVVVFPGIPHCCSPSRDGSELVGNGLCLQAPTEGTMESPGAEVRNTLGSHQAEVRMTRRYLKM